MKRLNIHKWTARAYLRLYMAAKLCRCNLGSMDMSLWGGVVMLLPANHM